MATVFLDGPNNSTLFMTCCEVAILDHQGNCPCCCGDWKGDEMNILQAFKEARDFVNMHSEPWYLSGQALLKKLDAAIEEMEKAEPVAQIHSFGCQPLCQFDVHEWGTPLYLHPAPTIPEGWQLVPKETTCDMDSAGSKAHYKNWDGSPIVTESDAESIYKAMLAAAPEYKP